MITGNLAGTALQAVLISHGDMVVHPFVNKRRANGQARLEFAIFAALLVHLNVAVFFIYFVFIQPQTSVQG
jgi:hypothetical protein